MNGIVKVGNSYVTSAGYAVGKAQADAMKAEAADGKETSGGKTTAMDVLKDLKSRYKDTNFIVGGGPFSGQGLNNISISPKALQKMAEDPDKRAELEALIYDVANGQKSMPQQSGGTQIVAHGTIIDEDGNLRGWGIVKTDDSSQRRVQTGKLGKKNRGNWMSELLAKLQEKKTARAKSGAKLRGVNTAKKGHVDIKA